SIASDNRSITALCIVIASTCCLGSIGGSKLGRRSANIDLPVPGGPCSNAECPPVAITLASSCCSGKSRISSKVGPLGKGGEPKAATCSLVSAVFEDEKNQAKVCCKLSKPRTERVGFAPDSFL